MSRRHLRSIVIALQAAVLCGVGWVANATASGAAESTSTLPRSLELSDDMLLGGKLDPQLTAQLLDSRFVGIALRAPAQLDLDRHPALPLLVASRFDGARGWKLPFAELAQLVAVDLQTGELRVRPAFGSDKRSKPAGRGAPPSADDAREFGAQLSRVDARTRLALPWQPGCWSFRLVYHDWLSNPVQVQLQRGQQPPPAPCRAPASDGKVDFRLAPGAAAGTLRISGRFTLPVEALGADRSALAATVLVVAPDSATLVRSDWRIPLAPAAGTPLVSGTIDHEWPARLPAGAQAYLVVAGQVHGPRPGQAAMAGR